MKRLRWWLLPAPFMAWSIYCLARGELRWELIALLVLTPTLALWGPRSRRMLVLLYPVGLVGLLYDSMRFFRNVGLTPSRVHACDLESAERSVFGIGHGASRVTLNEFFQAHAHPVLDAYFAIPYGIFIFAIIGYALYLYFRDQRAMKRFAWTYLALNVAGFLTYHIFPAAPPWYVAQHGCAIDLYAHASEGPNLARVDAWLGFPYFHAFYGRSNDVFGAVPSLHVSYPLLILLIGWKLHGAFGRAVMVLFFASMCCAAVYLDHHWVIDVICGVTYGVATYAGVSTVMGWLERRTARRSSDDWVPTPATVTASSSSHNTRT